MATAEEGAGALSRPGAVGPSPRPAAPGSADVPAGRAQIARRWAWPVLAVVLLGGLGLRLWGIAQGLPYAFNADEADHFVPRAVAMFERHDLNPHYFANPPALTYVLHYLFAVWYGGSGAVVHAFATNPADVYTLARAAVAVLGTIALWLLYGTGARLFGRAIGLLAAAIEAVAFLPVFYAHLALNDAATLAPVTLSLLGSAGVLRRGRVLDYVLAGVGLGLACASKYTAGIVLVVFIAAVATRYLDVAARRGSLAAAPRALGGLALGGALALGAFVIANPYALLDYQSFHSELVHQSTLSAEAQGKLGAPRDGGLVYYLWSLSWGLGWAPALAALGGAVTRVAPRRALAGCSCRRRCSTWLFMGLQGRYFGRWLLPIFPILCLLAAVFALQLANTGARWLPARLRTGGRPCGARGADRGDRRRAARAGPRPQRALRPGARTRGHAQPDARMARRARAGRWRRSVVELGARPDSWARRWNKYPSLSRASPPAARWTEGFTSWESRTTSGRSARLCWSFYEAHGYCWVVSGSTESGRAFADPSAVPLAVAYYHALATRATVVYRSLTVRSRRGPGALRL